MACEEPDRILPAALRGCLEAGWIGARIECADEVDSTNAWAAELARAGAPEGTVVIAEAQRRGRGRLGRSWVSPPHLNLYLSVVLRPTVPEPLVPQVSLLAGVATCDAVGEWHPATIKWPNDVLIGGRKVAGVLPEMAGEGAGRFVVLGIGVNLNAAADDFPAELRDTAVSLWLATGQRVDRTRFAARLLARIEAWCDTWRREGFAPIAAAWHERSGMIGERIHVQAPDGAVEGVVLGLADDGALRLQLASGLEHQVVAGDVTVIGGYGAGRR